MNFGLVCMLTQLEEYQAHLLGSPESRSNVRRLKDLDNSAPVSSGSEASQHSRAEPQSDESRDGRSTYGHMLRLDLALLRDRLI